MQSMPYGEPELLFYKGDMFRTMEGHKHFAVQAVQQIQDNALLNTPTEDIVARLTDQYRMDVPVLRRDDAHVGQREGSVEVIDYFSRDYSSGRGTHSVIGTIVDLTVPFTGDKDFFSIQPTTYDTAPPRAIVESDHIIIRVSGRDLTPDQVKKALNDTLDHIDKYLSWQRDSANKVNAELPDLVKNAVESRKAKLLKDQNLVANLGFNLKVRSDAPRTYAPPQVRRKISPARPASTAPFKPEPALAEDDYEHILKVVEGMTKTMERNPTTFAKLDEEALRDMYLVPLNGHFEGAATGETFNASGKTDIIIRVEDRNIFIAECKIWRGPKYLNEAVDQLLSYLTWRDTKTAIVVFNRNRDFSAVLRAIQETMAAHRHKKRGPITEGETRSRYVFGNPTDHSREIIVTVLAFDTPS
jgi:hypothetical protein